MVIDKLDALESALTKVVDELNEGRRARAELETQLEQARTEARTAGEAARSREEELGRLREENGRLQREQDDIRARVERILNHIPAG